MNTYKRHRFPPDIISYAVWLYYRFNLSHRDVEDLLAVRGINVSYETIRLWCIKFGVKYSRHQKRRRRGYGDTFYIDKIFVKINGKQSHEPTRVRERGMRKFKSMCQAQRFLVIHASVSNLFNLGRHLLGLNTIGISGKVRLENGKEQWLEIPYQDSIDSVS